MQVCICNKLRIERHSGNPPLQVQVGLSQTRSSSGRLKIFAENVG